MLIQSQFMSVLTQLSADTVEFRVVQAPMKAVFKAGPNGTHLRWLHSYALSQELRVNSFEDAGPLLSRCGSLTDSFAGAGMTLAKGISPKKGNSRSLCMDTVSVRAVASFGQASGPQC